MSRPVKLISVKHDLKVLGFKEFLESIFFLPGFLLFRLTERHHSIIQSTEVFRGGSRVFYWKKHIFDFISFARRKLIRVLRKLEVWWLANASYFW